MKFDVKIIPYCEGLKKYFYEINREWISSMFAMEEIDEIILSQPEKYILSMGGHIWFAEHKDLGIIGTGALMKVGEGQFELTKMGVLSRARGLKAGEIILEHITHFVKSSEIELCYLLTNARCEAAIYLYLKHGFVHDKKIMNKFGSSYKRCNVAMRLT